MPVLQEQSRIVSIAVLRARVATGFPSPADDYVEETIDFNAILIHAGHEAATFTDGQ